MKDNFNSMLKLLTVAVIAQKGESYTTVVDRIREWGIGTAKFIGAGVEKDLLRIGIEDADALTNIVNGLLRGKGNPRNYANYEEEVHQFFSWVELTRKNKLWAGMHFLTIDQTSFLDNLRKYFIRESVAAETYLISKASFLREPALVGCFSNISIAAASGENLPSIFEGKTDSEILSHIKKVAIKLGATKESAPTVPNITKLKEDPKNHDALETVRLGRKYLDAKKKAAVQRIVRSQGITDKANVPLVKVRVMAKLLKEQGITWPVLCPNLTKGEYVDDTLIVYTPYGVSLGRTIPHNTEIAYNTEFNPNYTDKFTDGKGGMYYLKMKTPMAKDFSSVSPMGRAVSNKEKTFDIVAEFAENIDAHRKKWVRNLTSKDEETRMAATIIEIVYQSSIRIGSKIGESEVDGKTVDTYGLTVLQGKHFKILGDKVRISYAGKAGQKQKQILNPKDDVHYNKAVANLATYLEGKDRNDFVFELSSGKRLDSNMANRHFKEITGVADLTIHKFRHVKANVLAKPIIAKCPYLGKSGNSNSAVAKWFRENMKPVGVALGHFTAGEVTGTTAIYSYIDPRLSKSFFEDCKVQIPREILTRLKDD